MKKILKKNATLVGLLVLQSMLFSAGLAKTKVFVIGDSTASLYGTGDFPRTGWAQVLQPFFNADSITVDDRAVSGRSSKSFYDEGKWTAVYNALNAGDFVIIQFAHNDSKTNDATRYTDPQTTYKDHLNIFISGAIEKGAHPILVSSIPRNYWQKSRNGDYVKQSHDAYTKAMKEVATEKNLPFVDMELSARNFLTAKGEVYSTDSVFLNLPAGVWPNYPDGRDDNTHFQEKGAYELCKVFLADLKELDGFAQLDILKRNLQKAGRIGAYPNPDLKGTITGGGVFPANTEVTLTARPASGFHFDGWSKFGTDFYFSNVSQLTITTDSTNVDYVANFGYPAGVKEIGATNDVKMYPNPAKDVLQIKVEATAWQVTIFDVSGKKLKSQNNVTTVDVADLLPGWYLVQIKVDETVYAGPLQIAS